MGETNLHEQILSQFLSCSPRKDEMIIHIDSMVEILHLVESNATCTNDAHYTSYHVITTLGIAKQL